MCLFLLNIVLEFITQLIQRLLLILQLPIDYWNHLHWGQQVSSLRALESGVVLVGIVEEEDFVLELQNEALNELLMHHAR